MPQNSIDHLETLFSLAQETEPRSDNLSAFMSFSDPLLSQQQLLNDARDVGLRASFVEYIRRNPIGEEFEKLRKNVPSRELIRYLRDLCKSIYWPGTRNLSLISTKGKAIREREPCWLKLYLG